MLAGLVSGTLARTQGYTSTQRIDCLNDVLILRTAARNVLPVLTANQTDFDLIQQVAGTGNFVFFET
jgi:hypothetical protein